jgi:hypothetical protein
VLGGGSDGEPSGASVTRGGWGPGAGGVWPGGHSSRPVAVGTGHVVRRVGVGEEGVG